MILKTNAIEITAPIAGGVESEGVNTSLDHTIVGGNSSHGFAGSVQGGSDYAVWVGNQPTEVDAPQTLGTNAIVTNPLDCRDTSSRDESRLATASTFPSHGESFVLRFACRSEHSSSRPSNCAPCWRMSLRTWSDAIHCGC